MALRPSVLFELLPTAIRRQLPISTFSSDNKFSGLKVGVCVSGGADSMVLAYLLKNLRPERGDESGPPAFDPHAIIVDHGARPESSEEARIVLSHLTDLDIPGAILKLQWPDGTDFSSMKNFEMRAREMRYQAIAKHALKSKLRYLFVGQHLDDQVETTILRLLRGETYNIFGLRGMQAQTAIPECNGIFGASATTSRFPVKKDTGQQEPETQRSSGKALGLELIRPLLSIPKSHILETCKASQIPFVNDRTNFDPTLTLRNAVRYMRSNARLPKALQTEGVLAIQRKVEERFEGVQRAAKALLCSSHLEWMPETLSVAITMRVRSMKHFPATNEAYSYLIARLVEAASPLAEGKSPYLLKGVMLSRLSTCSAKDRGKILFDVSRTGVVLSQIDRVSNGMEMTLNICRSTMRATEVIANTRTFELDNEVSMATMGCCYTKWMLWDNRMWIRLTSNSQDVLAKIVIRPLAIHDLANNTDAFDRNGRIWSLKELLREHAPGKLRYTLPVITMDDTILVLPTMDATCTSARPMVRVEVRYPLRPRYKELVSND